MTENLETIEMALTCVEETIVTKETLQKLLEWLVNQNKSLQHHQQVIEKNNIDCQPHPACLGSVTVTQEMILYQVALQLQNLISLLDLKQNQLLKNIKKFLSQREAQIWQSLIAFRTTTKKE